MMKDHSEWCFVVTTCEYAGNFERELVGWMTGQHNWTHGKEEADATIAEMDQDLRREFYSIIPCSHDGHEEYCDLIHVPGKNPSACAVGVWFSIEPTDRMIDFMKDRATTFNIRPCRKFYDKDIHICEFRIIRKDVTYH